jgi:hypothetical protein
LSGRYLLAGLAVIPMVFPWILPHTPLNKWLQPPEPIPEKQQDWYTGRSVRLGVTLITADYGRLACAHDGQVEGAHCAYKADKKPWPRDRQEPLDENKANIIQPYRTFPNNQLIFIQGLWAEPTVATRLHEEPSTLPEKKMSRFVVECDMTFVGELKNPKMQWQKGQSWVSEKSAKVARPRNCSLVK